MQTSDTLAYLISQGFSDTILERFWAKVNKTDGCWLWTATSAHNHAMIHKSRHQMAYAYRVSWMIHYGNIPNGLRVLHKCDQGMCVRPDHLFLGTQTDNIADMMAKGRQAKGEARGLAKLTDEKVLEIRRIGRSISQRKLGRIYGVDASIICDVLNRNTWRHI